MYSKGKEKIRIIASWVIFPGFKLISLSARLQKIYKIQKKIPGFGTHIFWQGTVSYKNTHLAVIETCVFRVYLRNHLTYKKLIFIYSYPCLKSFQMKKEFSNPVTKSADIFKNAVLLEKSKLLEKIRHFEKFKNFFHGSKV